MKKCMQAKKNTLFMTMAMVGALLLLGASGIASAQTVLTTTGDQGEIVTDILGLPVGLELYDVSFIYGSLNDIYGTVPRTYDWDNFDFAQAANRDIVEVLNQYNSGTNRPVHLAGDLNNNDTEYYIGYMDTPSSNETRASAVFSYRLGVSWIVNPDPTTVVQSVLPSDKHVYAVFTVVTEECGNGTPDPGEECDEGGIDTADCDSDCTFAQCGDNYVNDAAAEECDDGNTDNGDGCSATCTIESQQGATVGGDVIGLTGSGLVLQNNGSDDLIIDDNGSFTFATPVPVGDQYFVEVETHPEDPGQSCYILRNQGEVPSGGVTDVTVVCLEPRCGNDILNFGEECDDGNTQSGDGCSATCTIEGSDTTIDDLIVDFGPGDGIWVRLDDGTWEQLHGFSPEIMVVGDIDCNGLDDLVVDFGAGTGIWVRYDNGTWEQLHGLSPEIMVVGDIDGNGCDDLIVDFGAGTGIWVRYDDGTWEQLHGVSPEIMVVGDIDCNGLDDLVVDFGAGTGIWVRYDNGTWEQLHGTSPEIMVVGDINGNGCDDLVVDFGPGDGIWVRYDDGSWAQLHGLSPEIMVVGDIDCNGLDDLVVDFGAGTGIWVRYDNGTWEQLHGMSPEIMVVGDIDGNECDDLIVDFPGNGIWVRYDDGIWEQLHGKDAEIMVVGAVTEPANDAPVADFSYTTGGLTANFTDLSTDSDGSVVAWSWDFGDGNVSTDQNPSHTYDTEGTYTVTLTVTDDQGAASASAEDSVEVSGGEADFESNCDDGEDNDSDGLTDCDDPDCAVDANCDEGFINQFCSLGNCATDEALKQECISSTRTCLDEAVGVIQRNQCWGDAFFLCTGIQ